MAGFFGINLYELTDRYCMLQDRQHLVLKKHEDEACIFLEGERCQIYEARPEQCRDFPTHWSTLRSGDYCKGLNLA